MRPPRPLLPGPPFLTLYTNAFRRPMALARNFASVARQTEVQLVEQIVLPDHVGHGWCALFGRIPWYAPACRGEYVAFLNDDDSLASDNVVARLRAFVKDAGRPPVVLVRVRKGDLEFPRQDPALAPVEGLVDLGSYVLRRDVWLRHAADYGLRYQGDYDHAQVLWADPECRPPVPCDLLFATGPISNGRPEVDW